jgi:tetratricopeptide (TPR) repeat protein
MRAWWFIAVAGLALGPLPAGAHLKPPADSPAEQLKALRKEVDDAEAAYLKAIQEYKEGDPADKIDKLWKAYVAKADETMPKVVELARKDPKSADAFDALEWVVVSGRQAAYKDWGTQAVQVLREHHTENPKLARVCAALGGGYYWDEQHEPARAFLRAALEKNPDQTVRGLATFALARLLHNRAESLGHRKAGDAKPVLKEAEDLFQTVLDKYADLKDPRGGKQAIGERAKSELFEIRKLAIGKAAPEIEGEDIDGKKFKLSDYKGKVVVLDFWGHW